MKKLILALLLLSPAVYGVTYITDASVASNAAIQFSKLAALASGKMLVGNGSSVPTAVTPAGEVTMDNTGSFGLSNSAVIGKTLTGFTSGAGVVSAADSILSALQKVVGNISATLSTTLNSGKIFAGNVSNVATAVSPSGEVTMDNTGSFGLSNAAVIGKVLTGFSSGAGTVSATDTILSAINKLVGNAAATLSTTLNSGRIFVGNVSNVATAVTPSGAVTMDNTGAFGLASPVSASITASNIDWSQCLNKDCVFVKTLGASTTFSWTNVVAGQTIVVAVTNTASNWTLSWPATARWSGGAAPTLTTGAHVDVFTCKAYTTNDAYCSAIQNY